jgi:hypothetical protein
MYLTHSANCELTSHEKKRANENCLVILPPQPVGRICVAVKPLLAIIPCEIDVF